MPGTAQQLQIAPQERNAEGNTAKRHKSVHRSLDMQKNAYKYKNIQNKAHLSVPKSVRKLLHSADFGEKRNTTVTFSDSLLRLSCDKSVGKFKNICIFSAKWPLNLLTSVRFCDTHVTQELQT